MNWLYSIFHSPDEKLKKRFKEAVKKHHPVALIPPPRFDNVYFEAEFRMNDDSKW